MSAAGELLVAWSPPGGRVPRHCLEYEVQVAEDAGEAAAAWAVRTAPGTAGRAREEPGWGHGLQQGVSYPGTGLSYPGTGCELSRDRLQQGVSYPGAGCELSRDRVWVIPDTGCSRV